MAKDYSVFIVACFLATFFLLYSVTTLVTKNYAGEFQSKELPKQNLSFVGDVFLGRDVEAKMSRWGFSYPYLGDPARINEIRVGNFEASVPEVHIPTPAGSFTFSVQQAVLPSLRTASFLFVSLANNHSLDYGLSSWQYTVESLSKNNITPFGQGETASVVLGEDFVVAITGFNDVTERVTPEMIISGATKASELGMYQIAYVHWGEEYELVHSDRQEELAKQFVDAGYDAVIGHHPHVVQDIGWYKDVPIFYSLGNYIFDQYFSDDVQLGLRLEMNFVRAGVEYTLVPVSSQDTYIQPRPLKDEVKQEFLDSLIERSVAPMENDRIKQSI